MKKKFIDVLNQSYNDKKSLIAFNLQNIYHLEALKQITEELKLPVIAQFSSRYVTHLEATFGFDFLIKKYKNDYIYFHLDHCQDFELIKFCVDVGFDGVMYDGSASKISKNIEMTQKIVAYANQFDCVVEGELGEIGGVEDGIGTEDMSYANLQEVGEFTSSTNIPLLALGIGNAHGFYKTLANIDVSILSKAKEIIGKNQLFVLHGGSGLSEEIVYDAINSGVVKINFSTQIKQATNEGIQSYIESGDLFNEIKFEKAVLSAVKPYFKELINKYTK